MKDYNETLTDLFADVEPIRANICKAFGKESMAKISGYLPYEFQSLIIQDAARGVVPSQRKAG